MKKFSEKIEEETMQNEKLPFVFDVKKYEKTKNLDAEGWFLQLWYRQWMASNMNYPRMNLVNEHLKNIKENGIMIFPSKKEKIKNADKSFSNFITMDCSNKSAVNFITRADIHAFCDMLNDDDEKKLYEKFNLEKSSNADRLALMLRLATKCAPKEVEDFYNRPLDIVIREKIKTSDGYTIFDTFFADKISLTIDLSASDKEIKKDFNNFLKQARDKFNLNYISTRQQKCTRKIKQSKFNNKIFEGWAANRILAYIDLKLLLKAHCIIKTDEQIAEYIFPEKATDYHNPIDRKIVDDTLKPLADYLMSHELLRKLAKYIEKSYE
jgi:hypothetical protein